MTSNISDTDISMIKRQVYSFIDDIIIQRDFDFVDKYNVLYTTSKGLFDMVDISVRRQISLGRFDQEKFNNTLETMLQMIKQIQDSSMTQYDASVKIGNKLAKEYINVVRDSQVER